MLNPTIAVTSVRLVQGDEMRSCSTCGEVEHVIWTVQVNAHHPEVRCTRHASYDVLDDALGQQFAASLATAGVSDLSLADDFIEGVAVMLDDRVRRPDLAQHLRDLWDAVLMTTLRSDGLRRLRKARFLVGSAAFALLPSVPRTDDDTCEADAVHPRADHIGGVRG